MIIHFICRGNSFRSIIAEAYLNSLEVKSCIVLSSGTAAALDKAGNLVSYTKTLALLEKHGIREFAKADYGDQLTQSRLEKAGLAICMNQRVYDECLQVNIHVPGPRDWRAGVVMRCGGVYGGSGMGGIQGLPARASWMAARTWVPCLAAVEM